MWKSNYYSEGMFKIMNRIQLTGISVFKYLSYENINFCSKLSPTHFLVELKFYKRFIGTIWSFFCASNPVRNNLNTISTADHFKQERESLLILKNCRLGISKETWQRIPQCGSS